jgi:hypothetical protein
MIAPQNDEVENKVTRVKMPWPHMQIRLIRAPETFFVASRGGFKTSLGMAPFTEDCVYEFPRGSGIIVGPTFEHLYDNTLNALVKALGDLGFEENTHFVVRRPPPADWPKPFIQVSSKKFDNMMTWHNGFTDHLVSLARIGSTNALSVMCGKFDEAKLLDETKLMDEVFPIFRKFKNMPEHWQQSSLMYAKFFATDKLEAPNRINWILEKRKLNQPRKNDIILSLQHALNVLNVEYNEAGINKRVELKPTIKAVEVRLNNLRKNLTLYIEADHTHTQLIQGAEWYADKVKTMKPYELKVAIKNEDPTRPEDGYYPDYDTAVHGYTGLKDCDPTNALIIAADYQHSVSPIPVAQIGRLPDADVDSLNYINEAYTLAPSGLEDAVQQFCDKYKAHLFKRVYYVYDQTATGKRNDAKQYFKIVIRVLRKNRWRVMPIYTGQAPDHFQKFTDTKKWLEEEDKNNLPIRVNLDTCYKLNKSVIGAEATVVRKGTQLITRKEKKYENTTKYPKLDQSETTHFSDCFDMINHAVIKRKLIKAKGAGQRGAGGLGFSKR